MAGVPIIMKAMLEAILPTLRTGRKVLSRTVPAAVGEGVIAAPLAALQQEYPDVKMGSYPRMGDGAVRTELVLRSPDEPLLEEAAARLRRIVAEAHRAAGIADPY
jgi:molybdopterin-biosynthesis enzyme MoeA-like protein